MLATLPLLLLALLLELPARAVADEGVVEINQAKALAGGVTPGDAPGFPVEIYARGSYRLTSNLDRRGLAPDVNAILIAANPRVTLDLNGFEIIGENDCNPMPCAIVSTGQGILAFGDDVNIRNGGVRGMPGAGISINGRGSVEEVTVSENGGDGIFVGHGRVAGCLAQRNHLDGIRLDSGVVRASVSSFNRQAGFSLIFGSLLESLSQSNLGLGLSAGNPSGVGYGQNVLNCNNAAGLCTNGAQSNATIQFGNNICGTDAACP